MKLSYEIIKSMVILFFCFFAVTSFATEVTFDGMLDAYMAYDTNRPKDHERAYTTQPVHDLRPSMNLAYIGATVNSKYIRGRLALQAGDSVDKNTELDTQNLKGIQESYVGYRVGEKTWLDAGVFLGNIGAESWISKDNWTYTRAMNLDYVPYYSTGLRFEHEFNEKESFQLQLLSGWQNYSETNSAKSIGMQYKRILSPSTTFTYNNFLGDEKVTTPRSRFRAYHNFILKYLHSEQWQLLGAFDIGHQAQRTQNGIDPWWATTLTIRRTLDQIRALALRLEYYCDPHQANVVTGSPRGFQVASTSLNFDQNLNQKTLWRTEVRGYHSRDRIYPTSNRSLNRWDGLLVTSIAVWF